MNRRSAQAPAAVIMIRPHHFLPNQETAKDNAFQKNGGGLNLSEMAKSAFTETTNVASSLISKPNFETISC